MHRLKNPANTATVWQFLWTIIKPYRWWYLLILQAPLLTGFYVFANNYSIKILVDAFSKEGPVHYATLIFPIALFISAQIGLDVIWRLSNIGELKAEPDARRRLLLKVYDYIQYHSHLYFQNTPSGTILSKLKGILDGYDTVFASLHHTLGKHLSAVVISVFVLLLVNTTLFVFMLLWCALVVAILLPMGLKLNQLSNAASESKHQVIGRFSDNITNIFSLFYFAKRQEELKSADLLMSQHYVPKQKAMYRYDLKFNLIGTLLYWFMLIGVFMFMIHLRQQSNVSTGDLIFVLLTALSISFDLWAFTSAMCDFTKQIGDFKSSYQILELPQDIIDGPHAKHLPIHQGTIEFKKINFSYQEGKPIFNDLNLSIKAGEKIGLIGHSGAGKSTIVSLLLKNFKPTSGDIFLDGHSIEDMTSDSLRSQISLIPQDIMLFHRSIAENIGYAKNNATMDDIKRAAFLANIDLFIESLPEQYDTLVGERGVKLSGGQRQRIAIARAILKNAPIIILDEATSSLDTVTEQQIQQSIHTILEQNKATVIAIAHRLSTIKHMDRILVMDGGQILEEGSFEELMKKHQGYFKTMWEAQVNGMVT